MKINEINTQFKKKIIQRNESSKCAYDFKPALC